MTIEIDSRLDSAAGAPVALHGVVHTMSQQTSAISDMLRGCRTTSPIPPPQEKDPVAPILPPSCHNEHISCQRSRGSISKQKRIVPQGRVAATLSHVAVHSATKLGKNRSGGKGRVGAHYLLLCFWPSGQLIENGGRRKKHTTFSSVMKPIASGTWPRNLFLVGMLGSQSTDSAVTALCNPLLSGTESRSATR